MRKTMWFGIISIVLGIAAAISRAYELAFGFDLASGLPVKMLVVTPVLLAVAVALAAVFFVLMYKKSFPASEEKKSIVHTITALFGCAVMLALGGYVFLKSAGETIMYVYGAVCVLNGFSYAVLGIRNLRTNENGVYSFFALMPVLWSCIALIVVFRERISDPIIADYIFLLLAFICIMLFSYAQTGYVYTKKRIKFLIIVSMIGAYFSLIELIAPFIASKLTVDFYFIADFKIILPLIFHIVYMPIAAMIVARNENDV